MGLYMDLKFKCDQCGTEKTIKTDVARSRRGRIYTTTDQLYLVEYTPTDKDSDIPESLTITRHIDVGIERDPDDCTKTVCSAKCALAAGDRFLAPTIGKPKRASDGRS